MSIDWFTTHGMILTNLATALTGYFIAMAVTYVKFSQDLSYIKGQLSQMMTSQKSLTEIIEKHGIIERRLQLLEESLIKNGESHASFYSKSHHQHPWSASNSRDPLADTNDSDEGNNS